MPKKHPKCPSCNSENVAVIAFGLPSPEMIDEAERGDMILGGCCVEEDDP